MIIKIMNRNAKMKGDAAEQRIAFNRQPARMLLVDLQPPCDTGTIDTICEALEHVFSLVCSLNGPNRVPFFSIIILGNYPEVLYPLQHVRGNYPRIQSALSELRSLYAEGSAPKHPVPGLIGEGVKEAASMFKRQAQSLLQTTGYWAQLEITLMTCQEVLGVTKSLERVTKQLDLGDLKKVQVVSVVNVDHVYLAEDITTGAESQTSETSDRSSGVGETGLVDFTSIENNELCVKNFLLNWLHDAGTDREHLHLLLPLGDDGEMMTVKCDLQERILNPGHLSFHSYYSLDIDAQSCNKPTQTSGFRGSTHSLPIHKLKIIQRVSSEAICESLLYGMPLIVKATSCWKIDWDELDVNQQHFQALCHLLYKKNEVLLAQLMPEESSKGTGFRYNLQPPKPSGSFLLFPSHQNTMLLKSVAVSELLLPLDIQTPDNPAEESLKIMEQALNGVETREMYNPLLTSSDLQPSLIFHLTKNLPGSTSAVRRKTPVNKVQASTSATSAVGSNNSGFVPAKWAMDTTKQKKAKLLPMISGNEFYSDTGGFPTEL